MTRAGLQRHIDQRSADIAAKNWDAVSRAGAVEPDGPGVALRVDNSTIGSALLLTAAAVDGAVDVTATSVEGRVDVSRAQLGRAGVPALRLSESRIGGTLSLRDLAAVRGGPDLSRLSVGRLDDDPAVWTTAGSYEIRGLTYQAIDSDEESWSLKGRRSWLAGQTPFSPQPYEQLAGLLVRNGRRHEAWRVLQQERAARRTAGTLRWWQWPGHIASGVFLGHGYRPEFALWALLLPALGWVFYEVAWDVGAIRPVSAMETVTGRCTSTGACFTPRVTRSRTRSRSSAWATARCGEWTIESPPACTATSPRRRLSWVGCSPPQAWPA
ncbi:hypothetical protein E4P41_15490 [Geodermatophilus sp. DF01-2]|uniref:hypothetical protein n=1 Tax=Geodermatophilus sp. DF01-2 TaxID=2559610 RepID=UPI001073609D|nr:hypothetical protein [Geodermatophilus sp. DF01_2]TFV56659.1 hypothetical protein E4P41_15490 [Geodermatophilus sp. DF01_2]